MAIKISGTTVIDDNRNIQNIGVITATTFVGDGSGLTGAGSTVFINNATNQEFFPLFTETTSGTITASGISTTKLKFNPSTGTVTATTFVGALTGTATSTTNIPNLTGHVTSVGNAAVLGSFTSLQLLTALTDETGTGANVFATSPTLVTPALGTPSSGNLANCTFPTLNQNTSGTSASAAVLTTARNINGISFDGSANIDANPASGAFSNGQGAKTIQSGGTASGGSSGDIFYIY